MIIRITLAILLGAILVACEKNEEFRTDEISALGVSTAVLDSSEGGGYELAQVIVWAMGPGKPTETLSGDAQDYNRFKGVVKDIERSTAQGAEYEGTILLLADGERTVAENIQDEYSWEVFIRGPRIGASSIEFQSARSVSPSLDLGPRYLRRHGLDLTALSCFSAGNSSANAEALYLVRADRMNPALLLISISTGSAGTSYSYKLHFTGIEWGDIPGAARANYRGDYQPFGHCPYPELQ
ncbi:hypothetical protein [Isoalcanivorax indicus]|uniref:hypothetical protein n=1 Tax=Isoalcanivorax indicus TaxID=2202653 RepID=UPI0013C4FEA8|nr:hypothetical protein [Isoalcanivorax indicus]